MRAAVVLLATVWLACDPAPTKGPASSEPAPKPASTSVAADSNPAPMPDSKPQIHLSGVTDDVLAGGDTEDARDALLESLTDTETAGIRIDAPFVVRADAGVVPVLGAFVRFPERGEAFENRVAVVALTEGGITVKPALRTPKNRGGGKGKGSDPEVLRGSSFSFDARERLAPMTWSDDVRVYVAYANYLSNGITVRPRGEAAPAPTLPSPLTLEGPKTSKTEPGGTASLLGKTAPASAVHLVGLGAAGPFVHTTQAGDDGSFSVNLLGDNPLPKAPGIWHIYAFSGEHAAGPVTIELTPGDKPW